MSKLLGMNAKAYVGTDEIVLIKDAVTLNLSKSEAEVSNRGDAWDLMKGTTKIAEVSFEMNASDSSDAAFTALLGSYNSGTALEIYILDGAKGTAGSKGLHASMEVMQFNRVEARKDVIVYSVTLKPTDGSTPAAPTWYEDAGS